jgi:uncharacterized protein (TIGR03435 family)
MRRAIAETILMTCAGWLAPAQSPEAPPKFPAADVRVSSKTANPSVRPGLASGGRYEVQTATMVDLIELAYGFDSDKVLGGPSWLEMDRFDVIAKLPPDSTPDTRKLMLQSLLQDRFKLVLHRDTKPLPTYVLTAGRKPQLKEAAAPEEPACKLQTASGPMAAGGRRIIMGNPNGSTTTLNLGPGMTIRYLCRNISMAAFAAGLRGMMSLSLGSNPVLDETRLKGNWNFDLEYSLQTAGPATDSPGDRISIFDAVDKQLGLKLQEKPVPMPVLVVDSVNRQPTANPPGVAEALPPVPLPTAFEVASVKPAAPAMVSNFQIQPGGRLIVSNMPLRTLIARAFNAIYNYDELAGLPEWAKTDRFDIVAKAPPGASLDAETVLPMIRALLADRFKMAYHTEERPVSAYALLAAKPKMKKADPASRTFCKNAIAPPGAPPGSLVLTCQNIAMAQLADRLKNMAPELNWPVPDSTGIQGGWDFTLTYSMRPMTVPQAAGDVPSASEPVGGYTLFEALEKQLGLKLEKQKRPMPVIVFDRLEKPTEN